MTPKEKAQELINKFYFDTSLNDIDEAKDCSIIAVNEIIDFMSPYVNNKETYDFWDKVKQEIQKL
jgi:hypothetical protein